MQSLIQFAEAVMRLSGWLALLAAAFVPLERWFALHPRRFWRAGMGGDLAYYFLSSVLPALLLALPLALLAAGMQHLLPAAWREGVAAWPGWCRAVLAVLVGEIGAYWGHRWSHQFPVLWRFHAIHHSAQQMDWLVHTRAHPLDMVFVRLCGLVPVFALGLAQPSGMGVRVAAIAQVISTVWGFLIHANLRWRFGALEHWVATPAFHHWHHSRQVPLDRNFAAMFPWVDRLFGTLHLPADWPAAYGSDTFVPDRLNAQLVEPLLPRRRVAPIKTAGM